MTAPISLPGGSTRSEDPQGLGGGTAGDLHPFVRRYGYRRDLPPVEDIERGPSDLRTESAIGGAVLMLVFEKGESGAVKLHIGRLSMIGVNLLKDACCDIHCSRRSAEAPLIIEGTRSIVNGMPASSPRILVL